MIQWYRVGLVIMGACLVAGTMTLPIASAGAPGLVVATGTDGTTTSIRTGGFGALSEYDSKSQGYGLSAAVSDPRMVPTTVDIVAGGDTIQFTYTFTLPKDTTHFAIESISPDDGYSVASTTGFNTGQKFLWDNKTTASAITVEHPLPKGTIDGLRRVDVPSMSGFIQRSDRPEDGYVDPVYKNPVRFDLNTTVHVDGGGRYRSGEVIVGSYTTYTEVADNKQFTLFVPDRVEMSASPNKVIEALAAVDRTIQGDPHRDASLFVKEGSGIIEAGGAKSSTAFVLSKSSLSIYIHEFVHVNEEGLFDKDMAWFTEASAEYYEQYFSVGDDKLRLDRMKILERTDPDAQWPRSDYHNDSILAEPNTWESKTNYEKGARLLFALDAKLRGETDGEATIHDIMYRINQRDGYGAVGYTDFRNIVVELTDEETASWLDPYVLTSQNPPQPSASDLDLVPKFVNGTTGISGNARETFQIGIATPSGEGLGSVRLSIDSGKTTIEAVISDGNHDGRVDVQFKPYAVDGGAVLKPVVSADTLSVTKGRVNDPIVSELIQIDLLISNTSSSYKVSSKSIRLESVPTEGKSTSGRVESEPVQIESVSKEAPEQEPSRFSDFSSSTLGVIITFILTALLVGVKRW